MNNMADKTKLSELESKIGYVFKNKGLLSNAVTHSSYANEHMLYKMKDNERLEFLGDAVLELVSSEFLYKKYRNLPEGKLSRKRATLVCEPALACCARNIGLGAYLLLGHGEKISGGCDRDSILSDALEAIIGAIYLDGGLEPADRFINDKVLGDDQAKSMFQDSKTMLQEILQKDHDEKITYEQTGVSGPEHDKIFYMQVKLGDRVIGKGSGKTLKAAGQDAAYHAIMSIEGKNE